MPCSLHGVLLRTLEINKQSLEMEHKLLHVRIPTDKRLIGWLFTQRGRGAKLGTTENKSR